MESAVRSHVADELRSRFRHHSSVRSFLSLLVLGVLASPALADDREMTLTIGGGVVASEPDEDAAASGRIGLSWELPRLAMPDRPGYAVDGTLVPELVGGTQHMSDRVESLLGAGIRAELRVSQREMGILKASARAAFYLAARGFVIGKTRDPQLEFVLGEYFYLGKNSRARLGVEAGYFQRELDPMTVGPRPDHGLVAQVYLGFGM